MLKAELEESWVSTYET